MPYRLQIEKQSGDYPTIIKDIREYLGFDEDRASGELPTICLPPRRRPDGGMHQQLIGWQWPMGGEHTVALHDPDKGKQYWIKEETILKPADCISKLLAPFTDRVRWKEIRKLSIQSFEADEDQFMSPIQDRVYRIPHHNYILVEGTPADLIEDLIGHL